MSTVSTFAICIVALAVAILNSRDLKAGWRWAYATLMSCAVASGIVASNYHTGTRAIAWGSVAAVIFVACNAIVASHRVRVETTKAASGESNHH